jgi:GcvH upstream region-like protein
MLHHFRRYQKYIFIVVTFVVIASFSFFGTYSAINSRAPQEEEVFRTLNGYPVTRSEMDEMTRFIATDSQDKLRFSGAWGPNFLNDGVLVKDFLQTGLAHILLEEFKESLKSDLDSRALKESHFSLYTHPQAPFLSTENVWRSFAPGMIADYQTLKHGTDPLSKEGFKARVDLYLQDRKMPINFTRQLLRYQQNQYNWLSPDPILERQDLALFGYHTFDDWFGSRFSRLAAMYILNSSDVAENIGFTVSREEALADLQRQASLSFQENSKSPYLNVSNPDQYFQEQLRRMGLDKNSAVKIWQKILLFRRLFNNIGDTVFVSPLPFKALAAYAGQEIEGELYTLPDELKITSPRDMEALEVYLMAVAAEDSKKIDPLSLPLNFKTPEAVAKKNPTLVEKRYVADIWEVNTMNLLGRVGIKQAWEWEVDEANWNAIIHEFPELGQKDSSTQEKRYQAIESLSDAVRSRLDNYARRQILTSHPEWIEESFQKTSPKETTFKINPIKPKDVLHGVSGETIMNLLDKESTANEETKNPLYLQSKDGLYRYKIVLKEKTLGPVILTFKEAKEAGLLEPLVDQKLSEHYERLKKHTPAKFQNKEGTWKSLSEVRDIVASDYFSSSLKSLEQEVKKMNGTQVQSNNIQELYPYRLIKHMRTLKDKAKAGLENDFLKTNEEQEEAQLLSSALENQWKIIKTNVKTKRSEKSISFEQIQNLEHGDFSEPLLSSTNDLYFFRLSERRQTDSLGELISPGLEIQSMLGHEAIQIQGRILADRMKRAKALGPIMLETQDMDN